MLLRKMLLAVWSIILITTTTYAQNSQSTPASLTEEQRAFREAFLKIIAAQPQQFRDIRGSKLTGSGGARYFHSLVALPDEPECWVVKYDGSTSYICYLKRTGISLAEQKLAVRAQISVAVPEFGLSKLHPVFGKDYEAITFVNPANPSVCIEVSQAYNDGGIYVTLEVKAADYDAKQLLASEQHGDNVVGKIITDGGPVALKGYTGQGKYNFENGQMYTGNWVNGKPHGKGKYYNSDSRILYEGDVVQGSATGKGTWYYKGGKYTGDLVDGKKEGEGALYNYDDKKTITGRFHNDEPVAGAYTISYPEERPVVAAHKCGSCSGSGHVQVSKGPCAFCHGTGSSGTGRYEKDKYGTGSTYKSYGCSYCKGTGSNMIWETCLTCHGKGTTE